VTTTGWRELLLWARASLPQPTEARFILEHVAGGDRLGSLIGQSAPPPAADRVRELVSRRSAGEPLQYVLGQWSFRTLELLVDRRVLVPRPETEQVVEVALSELRPILSGALPVLDGPVLDGPLVADLGTGSGAIALSIATEAPGAQVWATDASADALAVAAANRSSLGLDGRVRLAAGNWYEALPRALQGRFSLIVSNPPYVSEAEVPGLPVEVRDWEPKEALVSGPTGLEAIAEVLAGASGWMSAAGSVVVELAPHLAGAATSLARAAGLAEVAVHDDLTGRPRILAARAA
jgi:release factor glutamine methyltransferase